MRIKLLFTDKFFAFIIAYVDCEYNGLLHPKSFYLSGGKTPAAVSGIFTLNRTIYT